MEKATSYRLLCRMIFYFSGTGNTRWVANQLAEATGEKLLYIPDELKRAASAEILTYELKEGERLGLCFPTHGWQPPRIVREFIRRAHFAGTSYVYAVTTCGDNMGHAMRILNKELGRHGLRAQSLFAVPMPESNVCFPFLHLDTKVREREKIAAAHVHIKRICQMVADRQEGVEDLIRGAIPYTYTYVIGAYYNKHLITDHKLWVDTESCIECGICQQLCPVDDIDGTPPRWLHNGLCTNCLACYHHCPAHAIHWGSMKRGQYRFKEEKHQ